MLKNAVLRLLGRILTLRSDRCSFLVVFIIAIEKMRKIKRKYFSQKNVFYVTKNGPEKLEKSK